jgi:hypothetical protein
MNGIIIPVTKNRAEVVVTYRLSVYDGLQTGSTQIDTVVKTYTYTEGDVFVPISVSDLLAGTAYTGYVLIGNLSIAGGDPIPDYIVASSDILIEGRVERLGANLLRGREG